MSDRKEAKLLVGYIGSKPKTCKEIETLYRGLVSANVIQAVNQFENITYSDNVAKVLMEGHKDFAYVILEKENEKENLTKRFQLFVIQRYGTLLSLGNLFPISQKGKTVLLPLQKIEYMERSKRTTYIHTVDNVVICSEKLDMLLDRLPEKVFRRCHVSYIVNMQHVKCFSRTMAELDNGEILPISRRYSKEIWNTDMCN